MGNAVCVFVFQRKAVLRVVLIASWFLSFIAIFKLQYTMNIAGALTLTYLSVMVNSQFSHNAEPK